MVADKVMKMTGVLQNEARLFVLLVSGGKNE